MLGVHKGQDYHCVKEFHQFMYVQILKKFKGKKKVANKIRATLPTQHRTLCSARILLGTKKNNYTI